MGDHRKTYMSKDELRRYLSQLENQASAALTRHVPKISSDFLLRQGSRKSNSSKSSPTRRQFGHERHANTGYAIHSRDTNHENRADLGSSIPLTAGNSFQYSESSDNSSLRSIEEYHDRPATLPVINFPKDHPCYQGAPPNANLSSCDPRLKAPDRNTCSHCHQSLTTSKTILKAMGNKYHTQCFQCCYCGLSLEHVAFYPHEGRMYCHLDYHELFSPRCKYCQAPIEDDVISAMGASFHVGHFFCAGCSKPFATDDPFHSHDNYAWCHDCFMDRYSTKCWKCQVKIPEGDVIVKVLGRDWCSSCFSCEECATPFGDDGFVLRDNGTLVCIKCEEKSVKLRVHGF